MWLVVSASGNNTSLKFARSQEGRIRGFLACRGQRMLFRKLPGNILTPIFLGNCLPLSIPTELPVHANGYFAIRFNSAEIWKRSIM